MCFVVLCDVFSAVTSSCLSAVVEVVICCVSVASVVFVVFVSLNLSASLVDFLHSCVKLYHCQFFFS